MKILSFDLGATNVRAAIINEKYEILMVHKEKTTQAGATALIAQLGVIIDKLLVDHSEVDTVVFGVPGYVRRTDSFISEMANLKIKNLNLIQEIETHYPHLHVYVRNDAELAGFYEATNGRGKHFKSTYYITISSGLGGVLFRDKKFTPSSDEPGHALCLYQGQYYEFEHLISGNGLRKLAALNGLTITGAPALFEEINLGVYKAVNVFEEWLKLFSTFLQEIDALFAPDVFVLGGGVAFQARYFLTPLKIRNKHRRIRISSQIDDAGLLGGMSFVKSIE